MKLKEFDLDLPNAPKEIRHGFRLQTRCVTALYERCFPGLNVEGGWKVLVEGVDHVARPDVRNLLGVFTVEIGFSYERFAGASARERKEMALEAIHDGAIRVAEAEGWPCRPFVASKACVLDHSYVNEWTWRKPRWNANRTHQAVLSCSHEADRFRAWIVVQDRNGGELQRELVISELPDEFLFLPKMGKLVWAQSRVVLLDKRGGEVGGLLLPDAPRT